MAELGFQSTALVVDITSGYKALIENFAPRMPFHSKFNVGLIHIGFGGRKPIVCDAYRLA